MHMIVWMVLSGEAAFVLELALLARAEGMESLLKPLTMGAWRFRHGVYHPFTSNAVIRRGDNRSLKVPTVAACLSLKACWA
jgi:hypothetical protein